ncbi:MAG: hypothetical protein A3F09_03480 [Chlamydiae bacterium RIFCSPHIGHO2_12_FULL_49_11]|nr:MAG: hypothetical protein A3F09_03480 [Chlamydiae bacterium RIFCSPHIGHO2_12_FULL_49_11]
MTSSGGFIKLMRSGLGFDLLKKPHACHLLHCIAMLVNRDGSPNLYGCKIGEARVGFKVCGLTDAQYRAAKKYLQEEGLAEFYTR